MIDPIPFSTRLKDATHSAHERLQRTAYSAALLSGTAPAQCVISHLRALWVVHDTLERVLDSPGAGNDFSGAFRLKEIHRAAEIGRDLDRFVPKVQRDIPSATRAALDLAQRIRQRSVTCPLSLAGCVYVLEGSRHGALQLEARVVSALGAHPTESLAYFTGLREGTQAHWLRVKGLIDEHIASGRDQQDAIDAALETFAGFETLFSALLPFDPDDLRFTAISINPSAGDHPIPQDERELAAALDAGHRCFGIHPYLRERFGERGLRFTLSDSAWLATLAAQDGNNVARQVRWLAGVLAHRGMPSYLLQLHLEILHEELVRATEAVGRHDRLLSGAAVLAELRRPHVTDRAMQAANDEFEQAVGEPWASRMRNTGCLVAAAVADERSGITDSSQALLGWLTDPELFPRHWIDAVGNLYRHMGGDQGAGA